MVRVGFEEREWLLEDAPETYYLTDYYRNHPVVLVRLSRVDRDALRDLLSVSWRLTALKAKKRKVTLHFPLDVPPHLTAVWATSRPSRMPRYANSWRRRAWT